MKSVLEALPADFPIIERPYEAMAGTMGITGGQLIGKLALLKEKGIIRRVAAMAAHRAVSYEGNAMVVWNVPAERIEEVGTIIAGFSEVSHCYERGTSGYWPYSLYTMVHGKTREACAVVIDLMASRSGIRDYRVLFSKREFKKTSFSVGT